jgi:hypothetical protein
MRVKHLLWLAFLIPALALGQAYTGGGNAYVPGISSGNGNYGPLGDCFIGNGSTTLPSWQPCSAGGSGTVSNGTSGQVAVYSSTGTTVSGSAHATLVSGLQLGSPTGGDEGVGTLNMTGCYINGVACATGSSGIGPGTVGNLCIFTSTTNCTGVTALPAANEPAHTGDVTNTAGSLALAVAAIQGTPVLLSTRAAGQSLTYNGTDIVNSGTQCAEVTANTTLSPTTPCVNVTTSGTVTITLPTAVSAQNPYTVSMDSSSTGTLVIATTSSQTINKNAASGITYRAGWSYDFVSNNANWTIH